ncbi:MAG: hypothetical protein P4M00_05870 [Azospirillaceae bacterium]|nr:hypothetical protein [Azospirillaceae bacterium]
MSSTSLTEYRRRPGASGFSKSFPFAPSLLIGGSGKSKGPGRVLWIMGAVMAAMVVVSAFVPVQTHPTGTSSAVASRAVSAASLNQPIR